MKSKDIAGIEAGKLYPENWRHLTKAEQVGILDVNAEKRAAYIAGRTVGSDEVEDYKKIIRPLLMLCEENGKPVDGFRFRELILELKQLLNK